jgi:hypothetical protein
VAYEEQVKYRTHFFNINSPIFQYNLTFPLFLIYSSFTPTHTIMQSMGFLLFLAMLLGIAVAQNPDPAFTTPDYSNPAPLHMVNDNGPMFRSGWDQNCNENGRARKAFYDAVLMAQRSLIYLEEYAAGRNDGSMFLRYFDGSFTGTVREVLYATYLNVRFVNNAYYTVTGPGASMWNAQMKYIDVRYDAFPIGTENGRFDLKCRDPAKPGLQAVTIFGDDFIPGSPPERVLIMLCKYAFASPDLPFPTDYSKCGILRASPYSTAAQFTLGSLLFHELLHDASLHPIATAPSMLGEEIGDFISSPGIPADYPPNGYGPWNALKLKQASDADPRPGAEGLPLRNADSYTMFAQLVTSNLFSAWISLAGYA